jgi:hypothetical protein
MVIGIMILLASAWAKDPATAPALAADGAVRDALDKDPRRRGHGFATSRPACA